MTDEQKQPEEEKTEAKKPAPKKAEAYTNVSGVKLNFSGKHIAKGGEMKPTKKDMESDHFRKKLNRAVELGLLEKA